RSSRPPTSASTSTRPSIPTLAHHHMTYSRTFSSPRAQFAYAVGMQCWIWGFPLTESLRTCRDAVMGARSGQGTSAGINRLEHNTKPSTHLDRWVVTPANDLLYSIA